MILIKILTFLRVQEAPSKIIWKGYIKKVEADKQQHFIVCLTHFIFYKNIFHKNNENQIWGKLQYDIVLIKTIENNTNYLRKSRLGFLCHSYKK